MRTIQFALRISALLAAAVVLIVGAVVRPALAEEGPVHIISPAAGTVVHPGETIRVAVTADTTIEKMALIGEHPLGVGQVFSGAAPGIIGRGQGESRPIEFLVRVPAEIQPGNYRLTAIGRSSGGEVESAAISVDVEKLEEAVKIWAEPARIQFTHVGERIPIRVLGEFADRSNEELTRSTRTAYTSANSHVATVGEDGMIIAAGVGKTTIQVRTATSDYSIPVRVE